MCTRLAARLGLCTTGTRVPVAQRVLWWFQKVEHSQDAAAEGEWEWEAEWAEQGKAERIGWRLGQGQMESGKGGAILSTFLGLLGTC